MAVDEPGYNHKNSDGNFVWAGAPETFKSSKKWNRGSTRPSTPNASRREIRHERDGETLAVYQHPVKVRRRWKITINNLVAADVQEPDDPTDPTLWALHEASVFYFWPDYAADGAADPWYTVRWIGEYEPIPTRGGRFTVEFEIEELEDNTGTDPFP